MPNSAADNGLMSMVWCKHGFQQRSNFDRKFVLFLTLWSKKLTKEFLNKRCGLWDWTNFWRSCKKLAPPQNKMAALKAYW